MKALLILFSAITLTVNAAEIHVSPNGNDKNPGTEKKPLLTLTKARDLLRERKKAMSNNQRPTSNIQKRDTVILHGGEYRLEESLKLGEEDSDTAWRAAKGETPVVTGGMEVPVKNLKSVKDPKIRKRLPESSRGKVRELALPGKGKGGSETWPLRFRGYAGWPEVYIDGEPMRLARWPNEGYATIAKVLDKGSQPRNKEKPERGGKFQFKEAAPATWKAEEPIYLGGYWCYKWFDEFVRVKSIDAASKTIQMAAPHNYGIGGPSKGLYFAVNLLEELDQPGEYVYDGKRHTLYMILPSSAKDTLHVAVLREVLVAAKGAKNLHFTGITFENNCSSGITITDCESVRIEDCTIRQLSGSGVLVTGGRDCGIDRSLIYNIGKTGVRLSGGDRQTLTPSKHFVENTRIHHFARLVKTYCPAVGLAGVGQIAASNHFHDAPHCAVQFGGNDHRIEFNLIERVCMDTSDAGAIYCGRSWTLGGTLIHGNFIRNLGKAVHHQTWGIYLDDMASGIEVSRNVIADTDAGMLIGGGRNNVIEDNVIVNCPKKSIRYDARGVGWVSRSRTWLNKPDGTMWKRLNEVPYKTGIWNKRFPYLAKIEGDGYKEPRHNTVTGNYIFKSPAMDLDKLVKQHGTVKGNVTSNAVPRIVLEGGRLGVSVDGGQDYGGVSVGPSPR